MVGVQTRKRRKLNDTLVVERLTLQRVNESPHIYVLPDFLSALELQYLQEHVIQKCKFQKSFVDSKASSMVEKEQRTSMFVSLPKQGHSRVASIERKAADLLGLSVHQIEPLQLVRYRENQFFGVHHDLGSLRSDGSVELPPRQAYCKRRVATLFVYINELKQDETTSRKRQKSDCGGCTYFPECNDLRVQPKRGTAVLFSNILASGLPDPRTVHAGEPVRGKGIIKYGLNIWACED